MAFCENCGAQLADQSAVCGSCGKPRSAAAAPAAAPPAPYPVPVTAAEARGFVASLFDLSFSNFVTPKLIKVLFVLGVAMLIVEALALVVFSSSVSSVMGILTLIIVAPIVFSFGVIWLRVILEVSVVLFRSAEFLAEIAAQGRRPR